MAPRDDMVESRFPRGEFTGTVLALKRVPGKDVTSTKRGAFSPHPRIAEESHNRGRFDDERYGVDIMLVLLKNLNFATEKERYSSLPGDYTHGLITGVK